MEELREKVKEQLRKTLAAAEALNKEKKETAIMYEMIPDEQKALLFEDKELLELNARNKVAFKLI